MIGGLFPAAGSVPRRPSWLGFLFAAVVTPLILFALVLWFNLQFQQVSSIRTMIRRSCERQIDATELLHSLAGAEAAERSYVVTRDARLLPTYWNARDGLLLELSRLGTLYRNDAAQSALLSRLHGLVDTESGGMPGLGQRPPAAGPVLPRSTAADHVAALDDARVATADLIAVEESALQTRMDAMRARNLTTERLLWTLVVVVGLLIENGLWVLWRARKQCYRGELEAHTTAGRLRTIFASTTDAVLILDTRGKIQTVNVAAGHMFGVEPAALIGRDAAPMIDLGPGGGDFAARFGMIDDRLAEPNLFDRQVVRGDGTIIPVDIAMGVLPLPGEKQLIASIRDISHRKAVEQLKDEFLATVSHELRTPLTSVIGALGLLRGGSASTLPDSAQRLIEIAENNSRRLIRLINDLLDIDKIGSGRMRFERAPFDLIGTARAALDGVRGFADERAVQVELAAGQQPLVVDGDHDRLLQVLANLLSNAVRVSPADGLVIVSVAQQGSQIVVTVDDQGPGVMPEFAERVFERFAQAPDAMPGGSGLGLAIAREIVVAHQGRIWFAKAPGGGARFAFSLPAAIEQQPLRGSRSCILVGEADAAVAEELRAMLETEDCGVECVASDDEVQAAALTGRYDALVLAAALPKAGGLETARALHRRAGTRKLPVIIVAATPRPALSFAEGGAPELVDWVERPVDTAKLAAVVRHAMERSAAIRPTVLHIDGDPDMLEVAAAVLAEHGRIVHATSMASARAVLATQSPDIVILDLSLPDGAGSVLLPELRRADGSAIPTVIYSALDVPPELERQVDAVLIKSRRSLDSLARAIHRILASLDDDMNSA